MRFKPSLLSLTYSPLNASDGYGSLTQVCYAYAKLRLEGSSATENLLQPDVDLQAHLLISSRKPKCNNHGKKGHESGNPCSGCFPNLNLLIECHNEICLFT